MRLAVQSVVSRGVPGELLEAGTWRGGVSMWMKAVLDEAVSASIEPVHSASFVSARISDSLKDLGVTWSLGEDALAGAVDLCQWLHRALLLRHPPGPSMAKAIAGKLATKQHLLCLMVSRWMHMDREGCGLVCTKDLMEAIQESRSVSARVSEKIANSMLHNVDANGIGRVSYSEFVARCLKIECCEVALYWYDLSNDWAKYLSPLLLGSWEGGIWHTGIAAFGREYYYGGRITWGQPGATIWGRPSKLQRLGLTTRSIDELREHVFLELDRKFDKRSYDVLEHNCNNFVDEVAKFLLGVGIPDEIRLQPIRLMNAPVAKMFRPLLNRWLGRVEEPRGTTKEVPRQRMSIGGA
jgi:hypothetical protein